MFDLIQQIPEPWRQLADLLIAPLAWIPRLQHAMWDFFFAPGPLWLVVLKTLFLPFRSGRAQFIPTMMLTWWDAVRAVWLFWVGMFRFVAVVLGWAVTFSTFA